MSDLLGAWSLAASLGSRLSPDQREAMARQLPAYPKLARLSTQRLWLLAGPGKLSRGENASAAAPGSAPVADDALAYEGFLALGEHGSLDGLRQRTDVLPEGHYVLVRAQAGGRQLSLTRGLSGGERLYYLRLGELVLFASSLRPLLAHPAAERCLNVAVAREQLLTGHVILGTATPLEGIHELLVGHQLELGAVVGAQSWAFPGVLGPAQAAPARPPGGRSWGRQGQHQRLARDFHQALCESVELALPAARPVALALSGGIDSSALAAVLRDVVAADDIHAFSYEFDDPQHAVETPYARLVARRLGIQRHEVFQLSPDDYHRGVLEHLWRNESPVHWPKAFLLPVARHIARRGHDRYFTGFGIGSHMAYLSELAALLPWLPWPDRLLRYWKLARFGGQHWLLHLARLHPGLEPPHNRLYDLLLNVLQHEGYLAKRQDFYPRELAPLLVERGGFGDVAVEYGGASLRERLQRQAFAHLISCVDVTRSEKASREVGCLRISPAHFARTIPYAYFPPEPTPRWGTTARRLRPGKYLLRLAYQGVLPDEVLHRRKSWTDAVASQGWRRRGRINMLRALPRFPEAMASLGSGVPAAVEHWEPHSILASCLSFWMWHRLFVELPPRSRPPRWEELW